MHTHKRMKCTCMHRAQSHTHICARKRDSANRSITVMQCVWSNGYSRFPYIADGGAVTNPYLSNEFNALLWLSPHTYNYNWSLFLDSIVLVSSFFLDLFHEHKITNTKITVNCWTQHFSFVQLFCRIKLRRHNCSFGCDDIISRSRCLGICIVNSSNIIKKWGKSVLTWMHWSPFNAEQ